MCWLVPPLLTLVFFSGRPPKASTRSVSVASSCQLTFSRPADSWEPMTCGRIDRGGGGTVGVDGPDIAAEQVEEAMNLALGVVEAAGAGPAVGAAEHALCRHGRHRRGAVRGGEVQGLGPGHGDEFIAAAAVDPVPDRAAASLCGPLAWRCGLCGSVRRADCQAAGRIGIARMGHDIDTVASPANGRRHPNGSCAGKQPRRIDRHEAAGSLFRSCS